MKHEAWKLFLSKLTVILLVSLVLSSFYSFDVSAQKKRNKTQRKSSGKVYNNFAHNITPHQQSCNSCHKTPTGLSTAELPGGESYKYPDINDYPVHDACISCHRQQFFKGARPAICAICHTKVSPRDKARFAFPIPNKPEEFSIRFPHDVHQDIIAGLDKPASRDGNVTAAHFVNAKFTPIAAVTDEKKTDYNNCTICHVAASGKIYDTAPRRPQLVALETGMVIASHTEKFTALAGHFKTVPNEHSSCFNCHYSEQRPTRNDCAGCHILRSKPLVDSNVIERLSLKFNHKQMTENGSNPHDKECSSCHVRITQSADLRTLDPDVPIFTCASKGTGCHSDEIKLELDRRDEDLVKKQANAQHQIQSCSYCHNSFVGLHQIPESHKGIKP